MEQKQMIRRTGQIQVHCGLFGCRYPYFPTIFLQRKRGFSFDKGACKDSSSIFPNGNGLLLLPQYLFEKSMDRRPLLRFLKKTIFLYGICHPSLSAR